MKNATLQLIQHTRTNTTINDNYIGQLTTKSTKKTKTFCTIRAHSQMWGLYAMTLSICLSVCFHLKCVLKIRNFQREIFASSPQRPLGMPLWRVCWPLSTLQVIFDTGCHTGHVAHGVHNTLHCEPKCLVLISFRATQCIHHTFDSLDSLTR